MTKKYILDANIYGEMVVDKELRKELRNTPKKIRIEGKNLRNFLLILYDSFTKDHQLAITEDINKIADSYYTKYRELGGSKSKNEMTKIIDDMNKFRTPEFIAYEDFKKILRKVYTVQNSSVDQFVVNGSSGNIILNPNFGGKL